MFPRIYVARSKRMDSNSHNITTRMAVATIMATAFKEPAVRPLISIKVSISLSLDLFKTLCDESFYLKQYCVESKTNSLILHTESKFLNIVCCGTV